MVEITCKFTKIKFEAPTKRTSVHPAIATWKQESNKRGWYGRFFEAIEFGLSKEFDSVEQFEEVLQKASCGEPFETPPPSPHCLRDTLNTMLGESEREDGSFLKRLTAIDQSKSSGYSLIGKFLDLDSNPSLADGVYLDCATTKPSKTDIRNGRKPYSYYTLFALKENTVEFLLSFTGRRLNECHELKQVWQIAHEQGLTDQAFLAHQEEQQLEALKQSASMKFASNKPLGGEGTVLEREGRWLTVLLVDAVTCYEDDDGITHTIPPRGGHMFEHSTYFYYCRPATDSEISTRLQETNQKAVVALAFSRLKEIATVGDRTFPRPEADIPQGMRISFRDKKLSYDSPYLQVDFSNDRLWTVFYNGRDGDDWSHNNYANEYVASFQTLTPELASEVQACAEIIAVSFPEAIRSN